MNIYKAALERAEGDLVAIDNELEELIVRKNSLENVDKLLGSLCANCAASGQDAKVAAIFPKNAADAAMPPTEGESVRGDQAGAAIELASSVQGAFLWKQIALVMRDVANFTIGEAGEAVERARGTSMGHTRSQQVRNAIVRHRDKYFRHNPDNTWSVMSEALE